MSDVKFVVRGSDSKTYELVPNGSQVSINWQNRKKFSDSLIRYRLTEFSAQCEAIRRGLATILPHQMFSILNWQELELEVCGSPSIDVGFLQSMAVYDGGLSENDRHVQYFWRMLRERFNDRERARFLTFVWGRSRLPTTLSPDVKFKIQPFTRIHDVQKALPVAHTCFFSLELPAYSSLEVMTERFTYAVVNCNAIDADNARVHEMVTAEMAADDDTDAEHVSLFSDAHHSQ